MNIVLWLRLFMYQIMTYLLIVISIFIGIEYGVESFNSLEILQRTLLGYPIYAVILAALFTLSAIFASVFSLGFSNPIEDIKARINWLLLGKYNHSIFKQEIKGSNLMDNPQQLDHDINALRLKMIQLSSDLQEFTASPVFVGEDTKEEIIENERHRIARELHDSVSQQLFASMMMISAVSEVSAKHAPKIHEQIKVIEDTLGTAQTEMRALLLHLRPVDLANQRLETGIENLLKELDSKVQMDIKWRLEKTNLESGIEDHLFRIVQEGISNTMRHSRAENLTVILDQDINSVNLKVIDDGIGFNVQAAKNKGNYGLRNIEERVTSLGGRSRIVSAEGQGTTINIEIPVQLKEEK